MKVTMLMVQTVDGKTGKNPSQPPLEWNSPEDRAHFRKITKKYKTVIMGRRSYQAMSEPLKGRRIICLSSSMTADANVPGLVEVMNKPPGAVIEEMKKRGHDEVLLAGGSYTNAAFLNAGLVDKLMLTLEPVLFGRGVGLCDGLDRDAPLKLLSTERLSPDTLLLHYMVLK